MTGPSYGLDDPTDYYTKKGQHHWKYKQTLKNIIMVDKDKSGLKAVLKYPVQSPFSQNIHENQHLILPGV